MCGQEIRADELFDGCLDVPAEKTGESSGFTFSYEHFHHFVSVASEQLLHGYGLCEMAASFSLYNKQHSHEAIGMKGMTLFSFSLSACCASSV